MRPVLAILALTGATVGLITPLGVAARTQVTANAITVEGTGEVKAVPDMAVIRFHVVTDGGTATVALEENHQRMGEILKRMRDRGVADKDIALGGLFVMPVYNEDLPGQLAPRIRSYLVTGQAEITVRNLASLGGFLDTLAEAGAHRISQIELTVADPAAARAEARRRALADARKNAELYAQLAGVSLGKPLMIQEQEVAASPPPIYERLPRMGVAPYVEPAAGAETYSVRLMVSYAIGGINASQPRSSSQTPTDAAAGPA